MADSNIIVTALTATGGTQQVTLNFAVQDLELLPYLQIAGVEIWAATSNNRAAAAKIGDGQIPQFAHTGLSTSTTRYYWARPVDRSGLIGEWYPVSATAGVSATSSSTALAPGSVGNVELAAGAVTFDKVNIATLSSLTVDAGAITGGSITGVTFTGGLFQTATSGRRVRMSASDNYLRVYNAAGAQVGAFGDGHSSSTVLSVTVSAISTAAFIQNTSTGPALTVQGFMSVSSSSSSQVTATFGNSSTGGLAHAVRGRNTGAGGGSGLLGLPSASGGFGAYAEAGGYGPFTGQHDGFVAKDADTVPGDIVIDTGEILAVRGIDDAVGINVLADLVADSRVFGVVSRRVPFEHDALLAALDPLDRALRRNLAAGYDRITINSVGEGLINVCGRGGDIAAGGLVVSSDLPGKGQRQGDDIVRSSTVAKAREAVRFTSPDQIKRIACTYHCG